MCQSVGKKAAKSKQQDPSDCEGFFSYVKEQEEKVSCVPLPPIISASWENSVRYLVKGREDDIHVRMALCILIEWIQSVTIFLRRLRIFP